MVQRRPVRRPPGRPSGRFRRGRAAGEGASAEADHRRRLGLSAPLRFRPLPRDLRRGRRAAVRRHGAFRRPGRGGRAPDPVRPCPCRHDHHPQDAARPARRHGADRRRGHRQEDQFGGLPGPAGRSADARHRRQGGRVRRSAAARVQGLCQGGDRQRQDARRTASRSAAPTSSPAAPTRTSRWSTFARSASPARMPTRASSAPASPATRTAFRSTRCRRSRPAASASARRPAPRAASARPSSATSPTWSPTCSTGSQRTGWRTMARSSKR